jgi:hypothetical protein
MEREAYPHSSRIPMFAGLGSGRRMGVPTWEVRNTLRSERQHIAWVTIGIQLGDCLGEEVRDNPDSVQLCNEKPFARST